MLVAFCESICQGNYTRVWDASSPLLGTTTKEHGEQEVTSACFMVADGAHPWPGQFGNHSKLLQRQYKDMRTLINQPSRKKHLLLKSSSGCGNSQNAKREAPSLTSYWRLLSCHTLLWTLESSRQMQQKSHLPPQPPLLQKLSHDDPDLPFSNVVSITFNYHQKTDIRDATIVIYHTGKWLICPLWAWASIISSIKDLPGGTKNTPVFSLYKPATNPSLDNLGEFIEVTGKQMTGLIQKGIADMMGTKRLDFTPKEECCTLLIWSAAATAIHMARVPVYTIMRIGRWWSSDAFF
jgi:hypothetical protein